MGQVVVGIVLTALLGGLLVPLLKDVLDRRSERFTSSLQLVDTLSVALWTYWKSALRVAYYGRQGERGTAAYEDALRDWEGKESWDNGNQIQIQVSRSKRLLPASAQQQLDEAQQRVVDYLDREVNRLSRANSSDEWAALYASLLAQRAEIDSILTRVTTELSLDRTRNWILWRHS